MIEHSVLLDGESLHVRARRGLPGVSAWGHVASVPASEHARLAEVAALTTWPRLGVRIYVGSALCRVLSLAPVTSVKSLGDYEAIAAHMFKERLGLLTGEWEFRVDPSSRAGVIACAMRRSAIAVAGQAAGSLGQRIRWIQPWAATVVAQVSAQRKGVATIVHEQGALLACSAAGTGPQIRSLPVGGVGDPPSAAVLFGGSSAAMQVFRVRDTRSGTGRLPGDFTDILERQT